MPPAPQLSPARWRISLILGLVLAVAMVGVGIWGVVGSAEPLLGWFLLVAGVAIAAISAVQLRRAA